ncbi:hypothetical protein K7432_013298 [Basidiobolus ranarum]|uniref:Uncharacterized protein n=1 Tax=Basidiobolus ranarum TaxID=34480 RepID=A0ABR2VRY7_9FUNG
MTPNQQSHHDFANFSHPPTPISAEVSPIRGYEQHLHNHNSNAISHNPDNSQIFLPPASQLPIGHVPNYLPPEASSPIVHVNMDLPNGDSTPVSLPSIHGLFEMAATEPTTLSEPSNSINTSIISPMQNSNSTMDHQLFPPNKVNLKNNYSLIDASDQLTPNHDNTDSSMDLSASAGNESYLIETKNRIENDHEKSIVFTTRVVENFAEEVPSHIPNPTSQDDNIANIVSSSEREEISLVEPALSHDEPEAANKHT